MQMPVDFQLRAIVRREKERAPAVMCNGQGSHYDAMFMADLCYIYLHYQVIPEIASMFSKPYEVRKQFLLKYAYCWTNMMKKVLLDYYNIS